MHVMQAVTTAHGVYFSVSEQIVCDLLRKNVASNLQGLKHSLCLYHSTYASSTSSFLQMVIFLHILK